MTAASGLGAACALLIGACGASPPRVLNAFGTTRYVAPWEHYRHPHDGVDLIGEGPVIAMGDGFVRIAVESDDGTVVMIRHPELGLDIRYGHLSRSAELADGSAIRRGEYLGVPWMPRDGRWRAHVHIDVFQIGQTEHRDVMALHPVCESVAKPGQLIYPFRC